MTNPVRKLVKVGKEFFELRSGSGLLDDTGEPIIFCPVCTAQYDNTKIYHRMKSAIYK